MSPLDLSRKFQLLTVTCSIAFAPFLALRVIKQLVNDECHDFTLAAPILQHNIYVDDVLFEADDINLLRSKANEHSVVRIVGSHASFSFDGVRLKILECTLSDVSLIDRFYNCTGMVKPTFIKMENFRRESSYRNLFSNSR